VFKRRCILKRQIIKRLEQQETTARARRVRFRLSKGGQNYTGYPGDNQAAKDLRLNLEHSIPKRL
jgi:hypothetical protein